MVKWKLIPQNIMDDVEPPKLQKTNHNVLTLDDAMLLLEYTKTHYKHSIFFSIAIWSGMRRGEILGLRWQDIDFENKIIHIKQQLSWTSDKGFIFQPTKTNDSERSIHILEELINELKEHRFTQTKIRLMVGPKFEDRDLVVATESGKYVMGRNILYALEKTCKALGFDKLSIHELRHTHTRNHYVTTWRTS